MPSNYFEILVAYIEKHLNFDCREYNESYIQRRLNARMMFNNLPQNDYKRYYDFLRVNDAELRKLYDALTVNVTQFFRDPTLWNNLREELLPRLAKEKLSAKQNFVVWSCGCSSGEEPYSLAILLRETFDALGVSFKIVASDIDELSLKKAKAGIYDISTLATTPKEYLVKYFHQTKDERGRLKYEIDVKIKKSVSFVSNNFFRDPPPLASADMIICRNVIIYFTPESKEKLLSIFSEVLSDHGWLILGKSEVLFTTKLKHKFYLHDAAERIYRKERRETPDDADGDRRKNWWPGYTGAEKHGGSRQKADVSGKINREVK